MTANAMQGDREMCLQAGMNDYVTKPIRLEHVVASLKKSWESLGRRTFDTSVEIVEEQPEQFQDNEHPETSQEVQDVLDPAAIQRLEELAGGDSAFLVDFIDTFLERTPSMFEDLKKESGRQRFEYFASVGGTHSNPTVRPWGRPVYVNCVRNWRIWVSMKIWNKAPEKLAAVEVDFEPIRVALQSLREGYLKQQVG